MSSHRSSVQIAFQQQTPSLKYNYSSMTKDSPMDSQFAPSRADDSQPGHARLGLRDEEDETAEVDAELQQHRQDRVHVEDVGQGPLGGEHLQRLPRKTGALLDSRDR